MTYYTQYWTKDNCQYYKSIGQAGLPLDHTAGSQFVKRGVKKNDFVYVVTVENGELFLIGKMQVDYLVFTDKDAERIVGYQVWPAPEHLIAKLATPMRFNLKVPLDVTKRLRLISQTSPKLKFISPTQLDQQTLRTLRILKPKSATELDKLLKPMKPVTFE